MRTPIFAATLVAIAMTGGVALGDKPPSPYPMPADTFRTQLDAQIDAMRAACAKVPECPKAYVESGISQMKIRSLEACRDGVVTAQEAGWVLSATPSMPVPPPRPRPNHKNDD